MFGRIRKGIAKVIAPKEVKDAAKLTVYVKDLFEEADKYILDIKIISNVLNSYSYYKKGEIVERFDEMERNLEDAKNVLEKYGKFVKKYRETAEKIAKLSKIDPQSKSAIVEGLRGLSNSYAAEVYDINGNCILEDVRTMEIQVGKDSNILRFVAKRAAEDLVEKDYKPLEKKLKTLEQAIEEAQNYVSRLMEEKRLVENLSKEISERKNVQKLVNDGIEEVLNYNPGLYDEKIMNEIHYIELLKKEKEAIEEKLKTKDKSMRDISTRIYQTLLQLDYLKKALAKLIRDYNFKKNIIEVYLEPYDKKVREYEKLYGIKMRPASYYQKPEEAIEQPVQKPAVPQKPEQPSESEIVEGPQPFQSEIEKPQPQEVQSTETGGGKQPVQTGTKIAENAEKIERKVYRISNELGRKMWEFGKKVGEVMYKVTTANGPVVQGKYENGEFKPVKIGNQTLFPLFG